jgi:type IV pilus assembly protein PilQ
MKKRAFYILLYLLVMIVPVAAAAAQDEDPGGSPGVPTITSIDIMDNAVEISVSGDFVYTAYKPSDPFTVVVELPQVDRGEFEGVIPSEKKGISHVTVSGSGAPTTSAKLEILLDSPVDVEPVKTDHSLLVKVKEAEAPAAGQTPAMEQMEVAQEAAPSEGAAEEKPLPPATKITEVGFDYSEGTLNLVVSGNGALDPKVFALDSRIVIDVPGVEMEATMPAAVVTPVKAVRYGRHDGKIRLVVDLKQEVRFKASTLGDKLMISFPAEEVLEVMTAEKPAPVAESLMEEAPESEAPGKAAAGKYTGKIISLDFQDADIVPIFRFIGDISGYNVVVHPTVSGTVTLKLDNVPWDQALDIILNLYGLEKQVEGNIMTIAPTAVFDKLAKEKAQRQNTEAVVAELVQKEVRLKYIEAQKMRSLIDEAKVLSPRGRIMVDERRNMLIVRDTPLQHQEIRDFIGLWDIPEQRQMQVLIEAKIVEANADSDMDLGIRWGGTFDQDGDDFSGDFSVNTPPLAAGAAATVPGGAVNLLIGTADTLQVNLSLEALETAGELRKLSNPRILTLEGQAASIQQGAQIPVQTTTAEGSTTEFKNANLSLNVIPTVKPGGVLQLQIQANNDTPQVTPGGETGINTQSITTTALVKDGETLVIGGIYTNSEDSRDTGIPGLRKIPILGWLFGVKSVSVETTELLILITPKILASSQ